MTSYQEHVNAIRVLAMDAVQRAQSGHPGMPMGMADIAEVLWRDYLKHNPNNPHWFNRDRFIISNGHGAMLQYALLHLSGYDLSIEDLKQFRQLHSKTPGHPEYRHTPGVETTTGPLGQGLANGVGMALAERTLAAQFNRPGYNLVDHFTYVFIGDGDLMEGISHEACSLAGTLGLGKLIVFYDDNGISIDGDVKGWFTDNTPERFEAYHWHVVPNVDGHDRNAISQAIEAARGELNRPSLICCRTTIGYGSPNKAGTASAHGAPLGSDEINLTRQQLNWHYPPFEIPASVYQTWDCRSRGQAWENDWTDQFTQYQSNFPEEAKELLRRIEGHLPQKWSQQSLEQIEKWKEDSGKPIATRKASNIVLNHFALSLPELIGGSADLTESNCTAWSGAKIISRDDADGNYIEYGVREFAMSAIMNGLSLHGGFLPFGGTFLTFSDYARNAVRLSALMCNKVIYVYTHDSIGLGEDGPTHQPIEHASMLRLTPDLMVWRPADLIETAVAWQHGIEHSGPSCLLLTRQNLPPLKHDHEVSLIKRGGYIFWQSENKILEAMIIATGSELHLALEAAQLIDQQDRIGIRVVSMPCCEIFKRQAQDYRDSVLSPQITTRVAVEAGVPDYWYQFVGCGGSVIGIERFGYSAPAPEIYREFGITVESIRDEIIRLVDAKEKSRVRAKL